MKRNKNKVGEIKQLRINIQLWLIIVGGIIAFIILYCIADVYRGQIKFAAVVIAGAAALYSAYYVGASLRMQLNRDMIKSSFEILGLLNRPEFVKVRNFLQKEVECHDEISAEALYNKIDNDDELNNAVTVVLGIIEDMSIAIQCGYVDEDILYVSLMAIVRRNWKGLRGYIEQNRMNRNEPELGIEFQKLANSWESGKRLYDGQKLKPL
jgi:hypothetical protein